MAIGYTQTTCGLQPYNTDWPAEFLAYKTRVQNAGVQKSYELWDSDYQLWKQAKSRVTVAVIDGATTLTSPSLIGKTVVLMEGDGFSKASGFNQPDSNGLITFTDGTVLSAGSVTIFYL